MGNTASAYQYEVEDWYGETLELGTVTDLPPSTDLRAFATKSIDHGSRSTSASIAVVYAYMVCARQEGLRVALPSINAVHARATNARGKEALPRAAAALSAGVCAEEQWPYHAAEPPVSDAEDCIERGINLKRLVVDPHQICQCLARGLCVVCAVRFTEDALEGIWNPSDVVHVTHAPAAPIVSTCVLGYNEYRHEFVCQMPWGARFGERGFAHLPYEYITNGAVEAFAVFPSLRASDGPLFL